MTRRLNKNINLFNHLHLTKSALLKSVYLKDSLTAALKKNFLFLCDYNVSFSNNCFSIAIHVFTKTIKIIKYKKKLLHINTGNTSNKKILKSKSLNKDILHLVVNSFSNKLYSTNLIISYTNLNLFFNKQNCKQLFKKFRFYRKLLFSRGFSTFIDFLKITLLLIEEKVSAHAYIQILGLIFKNISKKSHFTFFKFIKLLFDYAFEKNKIAGLKLVICGRINAKTRSSSIILKKGVVSSTTFSIDRKQSQIHVYTRYGVFGFKFCIVRKN